jgi:hypothetical protein
LFEKFEIYFLNFFCLEYELRNVFSGNFVEFTLGKVQETYTGKNEKPGEGGGGGRVPGGEEKNSS